jgi:hypothetical protein
MTQAQQTNGVSIDEIKSLYNRATEHSLYFDGENQDSRNFEAFLMLATLLEGVLTSFGMALLEKRDDLSALRGKRKNRYGIDNAINDIYLLGKISTDEFGKLEKFKDDRNKCIHEIFNKKSDEDVERYTNGLFNEHKTIFESMTKKFEEELPKSTKI